jgi:tetratricopeptide (TPR) repeat protein
MAIISLRAYNREIEGMIDNRQLDEAVAHCRHILATFPKHIATYRLLGKTHLEQQRISDATDIFQRVLSAIPDDFVSNVGMSIIREDENNLDAAIWHMELAYEAQPANAAIQDELRRLYGRRDGMQPPKPRYTRGALARMYAKGGLFDQAIAELRAAINEDPNRPDLQLLLAQMLYQTSQRVDAVDACMNILKKVPLCLEANRILAVSLPDADNSEVVKNSRQLVISMDPYYAFAEPDAITSEQVADNAVTIEKLDYKSGLQAGIVPEQPAWATSLGISMEKPAEENVPDWLKAVEAPPATGPTDKASPGVSPFIWDTQEVENIITDTSKPEGEIPDWMKDAGWKPATSEAQPAPAEMSLPQALNNETAVNEDLVQADIPEWLRGIAPDGFTGAQGQQFQAEEEKLSNPWLEPHQPGPTDSIIQWLEEEKPVSPAAQAVQKEDFVLPPEDEVPDWLKDLDMPQDADKEGMNLTAPAAAFTAGLSAFLEEAEEPRETEATSLAAEAELETTQPEISSQSTLAPKQTDEEAEAFAALADEEELPDWLKDISGEQAGAELPAVFEFGTEEVPPQIDAELQSEEKIPPDSEVNYEPQGSAEVEHDSHLPELAGAMMAAEIISIASDMPQENLTEEPEESITPAEVSSAGELSEVLPPLETEDVSPQITEAVNSATELLPAEEEVSAAEPEAFAWLKGLADEQDAQEEQTIPSELNPEMEPPEWVKLDIEPGEQETITTEPVAAVEPTAEAEGEVPEWIKGLGEETEPSQAAEELITAEVPEISEPAGMPERVDIPESADEELPAWITEIEQPEPEVEVTGSQEEPLEWEPEELPAWLKEITESEEVEQEEPGIEPGPTSEIVAAGVAATLLHEEGSTQEISEVEEPVEQAPEKQPAIEPTEEPVSHLAATVSEIEPTVSGATGEVSVELEENLQASPEHDESTGEQALQATLVEARNAINSGEPSEAINYYASLIKQNYQLSDIIKDLKDALYRYPVDIDLWVTLGDAHSQTNDLQEALNAYTKAEELVR